MKLKYQVEKMNSLLKEFEKTRDEVNRNINLVSKKVLSEKSCRVEDMTISYDGKLFVINHDDGSLFYKRGISDYYHAFEKLREFIHENE